jgi:hypothetical protein
VRRRFVAEEHYKSNPLEKPRWLFRTIWVVLSDGYVLLDVLEESSRGQAEFPGSRDEVPEVLPPQRPAAYRPCLYSGLDLPISRSPDVDGVLI